MQRDGIANQGTAMKRLTATAWVLLLCLPTVSAAHHSRAHYTGPMRELQGEVVRLRWVNPLLTDERFLQGQTSTTCCFQ